MKTNIIAIIAGASLLPLISFGQAPPAPPAPPIPPVPPVPSGHGPGDHFRRGDEPKTPVTWLGVETSEVPRVVSEQLGLARGFGLVVEFVVPEGPAAAAGVQQNDILKMLNDQILTEPDQLAKLIRSFADGTSVTLTVLRKGAEQKLTVKLAKHDMPGHGNLGRRIERHIMEGHDDDTGALGNEMKNLQQQLSVIPNLDFGTIRDTVVNARREAKRAAGEARRSAAELRVVSRDAGALKSTRIDINKAQVVYSDEQGEMRIENVNGKKQLTAKDPEGKLQFSGPVDSKEDLDKIPADVRARYEKLEQKDLPAVAPNPPAKPEAKQDTAENDDAEDSDDDSDDAVKSGAIGGMQQVSYSPGTRFGFPARDLLV